LNFEIIDVDGLGRIGKFKVRNKIIQTPNLFPVVHPYNNVISTSELKEMGAKCIFTNAYILFQNKNKREEVLKKGIHDFLTFDGLIATDSGAFQQYMYDDGKIKISPEEIEEFQENINSDFPVILDVPVQLSDNYGMAKNKIQETIKRARENIKRRKKLDCCWFGPIHGGRYLDLLNKCAKEINNLEYGVHAIGGLVKAFLDYRFDLTIEILINVKQNVKPQKPIHMFGLGLPQFFSLAILCGCDLMDSAAYLLYARDGRYFDLSTGTKKLEEIEEFPCHCPVCINYTPKELKNLDKESRTKLLAKHNLYISFSELKRIRQAIKEGNLWELVETRIRNHPNLVKAYHVIKKYVSFFEKYEKSYKEHGRLFTSLDSFNRPLFYKYESRLKSKYRFPPNVKNLVVIPEIDIIGIKSPIYQECFDYINLLNNNLKEKIHIVFCSNYFGIIPLELIETFPLGQHERSETFFTCNEESPPFKNCKIFFEKCARLYEKCALLIPPEIRNQFNEIIPFPKTHIIHSLKQLINHYTTIKVKCVSKFDEILKFFNEV